MEEIKRQFTGTWLHKQDDLLPNFFNAVGASDVEKQYMLASTPKLVFAVEGDIIKMENQSYPDSHPDEIAKCEFKLNNEFMFEPKGALFNITVEWKDNKMIHHMKPVDSHICPHTIEHFINNRGQLIQEYKLIDDYCKEVTGMRTFYKQES